MNGGSTERWAVDASLPVNTAADTLLQCSGFAAGGENWAFEWGLKEDMTADWGRRDNRAAYRSRRNDKSVDRLVN